MSMPEDQFDDDLDEQPEDSSVIRNLRKQAKDQAAELKALRDQQAEAGELRKKLAVYEANLGNLNEDQQKAVLATSAEMTADALRSQAEKLGFVQPPEPAAPAEDIQAFDRVSQAVAQGQAPEAAANYEAELANAKNEGEVLAIVAKYGQPIAN